jgi:hypothetical protein
MADETKEPLSANDLLKNSSLYREFQAEREEMQDYAPKTQVVARKMGKMFKEAAIKGGYAYYCLLNGLSTGALTGYARNLQFDYPRMLAVLEALDSMCFLTLINIFCRRRASG